MFDSFQKRKSDFLGERDWKEYKRFAFRDDMLKLSVGMILGGSFNKVINSISNDLAMPALSFLTSKTGDDWRLWSVRVAEGLDIKFGRLLGDVLDFLVVSVVLYLLYVKLVGKLKPRDEAALQRECVLCREMIRVDASRCRFCGGNPDGTKRRSGSKDKRKTTVGGDKERPDGRDGEDRNGIEGDGDADSGAVERGNRRRPKRNRKR